LYRILILIFVALLSGCTSSDYGTSSFTGSKPMYDRFEKISDNTYYIEISGNGFSNYEMLEKYFLIRAELLCKSEFTHNFKRTTQWPGGRLPDVNLDCDKKWCSGDWANFPLVHGSVECTS
jgi:hypothetical protein